MMDLNYFGSIFATRAVITEMKARRQGRVVFVSSQAGQVGLFGFTGYSATKFAVRGLAEALQMEVCICKTNTTVIYENDSHVAPWEAHASNPGLAESQELPRSAEGKTGGPQTGLVADLAAIPLFESNLKKL